LRAERDQGSLDGRLVDEFPVVSRVVDVDDGTAPDAHGILGVGRQAARYDAQGALVGDVDDPGRAARHADFGRAGRQDDADEQVAVVGVLVLLLVEQVVERLGVGFDALGQVDVLFGAGVGRAAGVVQDAFAHGLVGGFLVLGVDGGVDIEAARVDVVLVDTVQQLARQFGRVVAMNAVASARGIGRRADHDGLLHGLPVFGVGQVAQAAHAAKDVGLAGLGTLEVGARVEAGRGLRDAGQHGGLGRGDFGQRFAEIGAAGGGEAVGA